MTNMMDHSLNKILTANLFISKNLLKMNFVKISSSKALKNEFLSNLLNLASDGEGHVQRHIDVFKEL